MKEGLYLIEPTADNPEPGNYRMLHEHIIDTSPVNQAIKARNGRRMIYEGQQLFLRDQTLLDGSKHEIVLEGRPELNQAANHIVLLISE